MAALCRAEQAIFGVGSKGLVAFDKVYPNVHVGVVHDAPERTGRLLQVGPLVCPIEFGKEAVFNADPRLRSRHQRARTGNGDRVGCVEQLVRCLPIGDVL